MQILETIAQKEQEELPIDSAELEETLIRLGAEVTHPVAVDPVATIEGKLVAFWTA